MSNNVSVEQINIIFMDVLKSVFKCGSDGVFIKGPFYSEGDMAYLIHKELVDRLKIIIPDVGVAHEFYPCNNCDLAIMDKSYDSEPYIIIELKYEPDHQRIQCDNKGKVKDIDNEFPFWKYKAWRYPNTVPRIISAWDHIIKDIKKLKNNVLRKYQIGYVIFVDEGRRFYEKHYRIDKDETLQGVMKENNQYKQETIWVNSELESIDANNLSGPAILLSKVTPI